MLHRPKQAVDGVAIKPTRLVVAIEVRNVVAAFLEVLVAGRAFLPIPSLLVGNCDGCEDRKLFDGQRDMGKIRNAERCPY